MGRGETGALAALPVWIDFMGTVLEGTPIEDFTRPSGVELVPVDRRTGRRASADTGCDPGDVILDAFVTGTEPTAYCSAAEHFRLSLPYFLQRFEVNDRRELVGEPEEIARVIQAGASNPRISRDGRVLDATGENGALSVTLALDPAQRKELLRLVATPSPPPAEGEGPWYGLDGRRATVRVVHRD